MIFLPGRPGGESPERAAARISKHTVDGYMKRTIPTLLAGGQLKKAFDPSPNIDPQFYLHVEKNFPELYADLPKIPAEIHVAGK